MRKRERETRKLQEKLHAVLMEKKKDAKAGRSGKGEEEVEQMILLVNNAWLFPPSKKIFGWVYIRHRDYQPLAKGERQPKHVDILIQSSI